MADGEGLEFLGLDDGRWRLTGVGMTQEQSKAPSGTSECLGLEAAEGFGLGLDVVRTAEAAKGLKRPGTAKRKLKLKTIADGEKRVLISPPPARRCFIVSAVLVLVVAAR